MSIDRPSGEFAEENENMAIRRTVKAGEFIPFALSDNRTGNLETVADFEVVLINEGYQWKCFQEDSPRHSSTGETEDEAILSYLIDTASRYASAVEASADVDIGGFGRPIRLAWNKLLSDPVFDADDREDSASDNPLP